MLTCVVISVPFVFSGIVVCLAPDPVPRAGQPPLRRRPRRRGLGCVLLVVAFTVLDGPEPRHRRSARSLAAGRSVFAARRRQPRAAWRCRALVARRARRLSPRSTAYLHSQGNPLLRIVWAKEQADPLHALRAVERLLARHRRRARRRTVGPPTGYGMSPTLPTGIAARRRCRWSSTAPPERCSPATTAIRRDHRLPPLRHHEPRALRARRRRRPRRSASAAAATSSPALEFDQRRSPASRSTATSSTSSTAVYGDFTGHLDRDPRVDARQRRGPQLPRTRPSALRRHPDLAHRHVGGDVGRRLRPDRELAVHDRGVGHRSSTGSSRAACCRCRAGTPPGRPPSRSRRYRTAVAGRRGADPTRRRRSPRSRPRLRGRRPAVRRRPRRRSWSAPSRSPARSSPSTADERRRASAFTPGADARPTCARPALRRPRRPGRARRRPRRVRRRHLAAHRRPAVLLPDGRPRHVPVGRGLLATTSSPGRCWCSACSPSTVLLLAAVCIGVPARRTSGGAPATRAWRRSTCTSPASGSGSC